MKVILAALAAFLTLRAAASAFPAGWEEVDGVFGHPGKDQPGDVRRFSWPRTDLKVQIAGIAIEPALALGSWGAFHRVGSGTEVMGDLVLLGPEVAAVVRALEAGGFEILAIHNHLIDETPRLMYVHYHGMGDAVTIARTLKAALEKSATPLAAPAGSVPAKPTEEQEKTFARLQEALGRKGAMAGRVLQVNVPRARPILDSNREVPASMGMAEAMNFETVGERVAATGDFVLVADEVNPVIRELHTHGLEATALHSHMLRETPRLFFLHFWGVDAPEKIGAGMKAALSKIAVQ